MQHDHGEIRWPDVVININMSQLWSAARFDLTKPSLVEFMHRFQEQYIHVNAICITEQTNKIELCIEGVSKYARCSLCACVYIRAAASRARARALHKLGQRKY